MLRAIPEVSAGSRFLFFFFFLSDFVLATFLNFMPHICVLLTPVRSPFWTSSFSFRDEDGREESQEDE